MSVLLIRMKQCVMLFSRISKPFILRFRNTSTRCSFNASLEFRIFTVLSMMHTLIFPFVITIRHVRSSSLLMATLFFCYLKLIRFNLQFLAWWCNLDFFDTCYIDTHYNISFEVIWSSYYSSLMGEHSFELIINWTK